MRAFWIIILALLPVSAVLAEVAAPAKTAAAAAPQAAVSGVGSKGYVWNKMTPEHAAAMSKAGDVERGRIVFRGCLGCHRKDGFGRVDGIYPRLTGQYASVIIKQLTDIRAGLRINPKMEPFITPDAVTVDEIADIAAYLSTATTLKENGKGPGDQVQVGEAVYTQKGCVKCHGARGEGDEAKFYPALAAQHYSYLLREMELVKTLARGNAHPDMVKALSEVSPADMDAMADYLSRLPDRRQTAEKAMGK
jgi:cytochrome c553